MISEKFVIFGAVLGLIGSFSYIKGTIQGRVKPNRATWFVISRAPMLAVAGEINKGVGLRSLVTFMSGFIPLLIFLASFVNKKSYWQLKKFDYICGSLAIVGLILWKLSGEGNVAISFAIFADFIAFFPTLRKAYTHPHTEDYVVFATGIVAVCIGLLVIDSWYFANWAFPLYLLVMDSLMVYFVGVRPALLKTNNQDS